jgi:nicotinamidase-related amidase
MSDQLLPLPLTERSVHLCVDMQRIFSADGPWPTPWMERVLPVAAALAARILQTRSSSPARKQMFASSHPFWMLLTWAIALSSCAMRYAARLTKGKTC